MAGSVFFCTRYALIWDVQERTSAVSSTIIAAVPLFTAILSEILLQEKIMRVQWNGIILAFTGVLILVFEPGKMEITLGNTMASGRAAVILSFYNLVQRKLTQRYTALQVSVYSIFCGFLFLCIFAPKGWRVIGVLSTFVGVYRCYGDFFKCSCICLLGKSIKSCTTDIQCQQFYVFDTIHCNGSGILDIAEKHYPFKMELEEC